MPAKRTVLLLALAVSGISLAQPKPPAHLIEEFRANPMNFTEEYLRRVGWDPTVSDFPNESVLKEWINREAGGGPKFQNVDSYERNQAFATELVFEGLATTQVMTLQASLTNPIAVANGLAQLGKNTPTTLAPAASKAAGGAPSLPTFVKGGKTAGVLRTASGDLPLLSGCAGPAASLPRGTPGFDVVTRTHVEGHAAAAMRAQGVSEATLYINNPNVCTSCATLLPRMLPPGTRLTVVTPTGSTTFVGGQP